MNEDVIVNCRCRTVIFVFDGGNRREVAQLVLAVGCSLVEHLESLKNLIFICCGVTITNQNYLENKGVVVAWLRVSIISKDLV